MNKELSEACLTMIKAIHTETKRFNLDYTIVFKEQGTQEVKVGSNLELESTKKLLSKVLETIDPKNQEEVE